MSSAQVPRRPLSAPQRRCRRSAPGGAPRALSPGSPRPSEVLGVFFVAALLSMAAGAAAAIVHALTGSYWAHWLSLHLLLLGGVSQLVLGAGQFFVCAFLATDPPPRRLVGAQLAAWNGGSAMVAIGVPADQGTLVEAGGALIATGLLLFAWSLRGMERRSLQRAPWALRWYQASAACLGLGALIGVVMAREMPWSHGDLLGAHLALNLGGWLGTAIVGTLHTFFPSLTQTQLRHPRLQRPTFGLWLAGVAALALGSAFARDWLLAGGWAALLVAAGLLVANVAASLAASLAASPARPLPLPARLLALALAFLPAGLLVALVATLRSGADGPFADPTRGTLAALLLAGWIGLTVAGSLLHLLAVIARIRSFALAMPRARRPRDVALTAAAGLAVSGLALSHVAALHWLSPEASLLAIAVAAALAAEIAAAAWRAVRAPSRRPPARAEAAST